MSYLIAGLVLIGLLSLLNLAMTLALARRVSDRKPAERQPRRPGERVASFSGRFDGVGLVAFLSPGCPPCREQVPQVLAMARELGPQRTVAVIVDDNGSPAEVAEEVEKFGGLAVVVVGRTGDELTGAFGVDAYPSMFLVDADGAVTAAGHDMAALR